MASHSVEHPYVGTFGATFRGLVLEIQTETEIDATNMNGRTPLHFAVDMFNKHCVSVIEGPYEITFGIQR